MKTEPPARHLQQGEAPPESLIHHEEPTLLEQWFRHAAERGASFWITVALVVALAIVGVYAVRSLGRPGAAAAAAWTELAAIGTAPASSSPFGPSSDVDLPGRLREIARSHADTPAAAWADLRAATLLLNQGSAELATTRRSAATGMILDADDLFEAVLEAAPADAPLQRNAALGRARAAEARLGLDADDPAHAKLSEVLALYQGVADDYPETPEGDFAADLRRRLDRGESRAFYEQLARYDADALLSDPEAASGLPGFNLGPGESSPLLNFPGLSPSRTTGGGGLPGGSLPGFEFSPPADLPPAPEPPTNDAAMPAPEAVPPPGGAEPSSEEPAPGAPTIPVDPAPAEVEPATAPATDEPAPAPSESTEIPDDPFGDAPSPTVAPSPAPATDEPSPAPSETTEIPDDPFGDTPSPTVAPSPAPVGELPEDVFPSSGPSR